MRVTKTVREYIEKQVREKAYQSAHLVELKKKADKAKEKFDADVLDLNNEINAKVQAIKIKYQIDDGYERRPLANSYWPHLPEEEAYWKARFELDKKVKQVTTEIIVEMELGGTKAELMERLNALEF